MKKINVSEIFYILASISFLTYLFTTKSAFMFCGGLFLITASILLTKEKKTK